MRSPANVLSRLPWSPGRQAIPFILGPAAFTALPDHLDDADQVFIITEAAIWPAIRPLLLPALPKRLRVDALFVNAGEGAKTLATIDLLAAEALRLGCTRRSVIISAGGGLVCNLAGMLAGTLFRGLHLIHAPTTLLAMHDTVTSLKQAVNVSGFKNLLGIYHRPAAILADLRVLADLPHSAIQAALVEIVKNGLVLGGRYLDDAAAILAAAADSPHITADYPLLKRIIRRGVAAKQSLMIADPFEKKRAIVFEYGHTLGHALESLSHGQLNHGQCIYWGMQFAALVSHRLGKLSSRHHTAHEQLLRQLGEIPSPPQLAADDIVAAMQLDNKRGHLPTRRNYIAMFLLKSPGHPLLTSSLPLTHVAIARIRTCLRTLPFVD